MAEEKPKQKTNGKRNKAAGNKWETDVVKILKERNLYPHCCTCRMESKRLDDAGIDVMNTDEARNGIMRDSIQCKTSSVSIAYPGLLARIHEADRPGGVIFHRQTSADASGRQMERDRFAITKLDRYIDLMACEAFMLEMKAMVTDPYTHKYVGDEITAKLKKYQL